MIFVVAQKVFDAIVDGISNIFQHSCDNHPFVFFIQWFFILPTYILALILCLPFTFFPIAVIFFIRILGLLSSLPNNHHVSGPRTAPLSYQSLLSALQVSFRSIVSFALGFSFFLPSSSPFYSFPWFFYPRSSYFYAFSLFAPPLFVFSLPGRLQKMPPTCHHFIFFIF